MKKILKGDDVIVIAGRDKGKRGTVSSIVSDRRILIDGINVVKKHQKANPNAGINGGIINKEMPIHISNIALYNSEIGKHDRVAIKTIDGKKMRVFKSTNNPVSI